MVKLPNHHALLNVKDHIRNLNGEQVSPVVHQYVLLLGSNLGNRISNLQHATDSIVQQIGSVKKLSKIYSSEPWGFISLDGFVNRALIVVSTKSPQELMVSIHEIEFSLGRIRDSSLGYASRTIDIDILHWDGGLYRSENLQIPHALLCRRRFALMPLTDVLPKGIHPELNLTYTELLLRCADTNAVKAMGE